jgi:hypothetical protein
MNIWDVSIPIIHAHQKHVIPEHAVEATAVANMSQLCVHTDMSADVWRRVLENA